MLSGSKPRQSSVAKTSDQLVYVLHSYPFKETSLLVELFSKHYGRVAALAKGSRRPRSAMRGMLQLFQLLDAAWSGKGEIKTLHSLDWAAGLTLINGDALMCGFYMNELLLRLLPREDSHEALFDYYGDTLTQLSKLSMDAGSIDIAIVLRKFELRLLQELGYAVPLLNDDQGLPILVNKQYRYEAEYGARDTNASKLGVLVTGKTLLNMANNDYSTSATQQQSKLLMRYLLTYYLGEKPLHTRQLLIDLQGF